MDGVALITAERQRQLDEEGWTDAHDDEHDQGELALAAGVYAIESVGGRIEAFGRYWPWDKTWFKPSGDRVRDLAKAGSLIAAEIDRLQRLKPGSG